MPKYDGNGPKNDRQGMGYPGRIAGGTSGNDDSGSRNKNKDIEKLNRPVLSDEQKDRAYEEHAKGDLAERDQAEKEGLSRSGDGDYTAAKLVSNESKNSLAMRAGLADAQPVADNENTAKQTQEKYSQSTSLSNSARNALADSTVDFASQDRDDSLTQD